MSTPMHENHEELEATTNAVLREVLEERIRQDKRWGIQNHPNGTSSYFTALADEARSKTETARDGDGLTWRHILFEEVAESSAEINPEKLREELIQVAAVAVAWIEKIDRIDLKN